LCLIAKLTSVSGECDVGTQNVNINWNEVGISVLTRFLKKKQLIKLLLAFRTSFVVSLTNCQ
jgi:hypothetical protein